MFRQIKNMNINNVILYLVVLSIFSGVAYFIYENAQYSRTVTQIRMAINQTINENDAASTYKDVWGTTIEVYIEPQTDKGVAYLGVSAGKDKTFDTDDDIKITEMDWNKARIVGNFIGKKSKETFKGLIGGIFSK
jgi:type II secretory pathway pseudopilin PulG